MPGKGCVEGRRQQEDSPGCRAARTEGDGGRVVVEGQWGQRSVKQAERGWWGKKGCKERKDIALRRLFNMTAYTHNTD